MPASPSVTDPDPLTLEELQEQNNELEHCLKKYKGQSCLSVLPLLTLYYRYTQIYKTHNQTDYSAKRRGRQL